MIDERAIGEQYAALRDQLDERGRRLYAAAEVRALGYGGLAGECRNFRVGAITMEAKEPPMARRKQPTIPDALLDQLLTGGDPRDALAGKDGLTLPRETGPGPR